MASRVLGEAVLVQPGGRAEGLSSWATPSRHKPRGSRGQHTHIRARGASTTHACHTWLTHTPRHTSRPGHPAVLDQQHVLGLRGRLILFQSWRLDIGNPGVGTAGVACSQLCSLCPHVVVLCACLCSDLLLHGHKPHWIRPTCDPTTPSLPPKRPLLPV